MQEYTIVSKKYHHLLAEYFRAREYFLESIEAQRERAKRIPPSPRPVNTRKVVELPWQSIKSQNWDIVESLFTDLWFLEAKSESGNVFGLLADFSLALQYLPSSATKYDIISLIGEALRRDVHFISRHASDYPQSLFQCIWNSCWWHDAIDAERHYQLHFPNQETESLPWKSNAPKISTLVEDWLRLKRTLGLNPAWFRALRPPSTPILVSESRIFYEHQTPVSLLTFNSSGEHVISCDRQVSLIWNVNTFKISGYVRNASFKSIHPLSSGSLLIIDKNWNVCLLDIYSGIELNKSDAKYEEGEILTVSPDGLLAAIVLPDRSVHVLSVHDFTEYCCFYDSNSIVRLCSFSSNNDLLVYATLNNVILFDIVRSKLIYSVENIFDGNSYATSLSFSANNLNILVGISASRSIVIDTKTSVILRSFHHPLGFSPVASFSNDGQRVAVGANSYHGYYAEDIIELWDWASGHKLRTFKGHKASINCISFSANGRWMASGSEDSSIRIWDLTISPKHIKLHDKHGQILSLAFSPDQSYVVVGDRNYGIRLWDFNSGVELKLVGGHDSPIYGVAFSPDSEYVASCSGDTLVLDSDEWVHIGEEDNVIKIWQLSKSQLCATLRGHTRTVTGVSFSSDGGRVLSQSDDGTIREWDIHTGECLKSSSQIGSKEAEYFNTSIIHDKYETVIKLVDKEDNFARIGYFHVPLNITIQSQDGTSLVGAHSDDLYFLKLEY